MMNLEKLETLNLKETPETNAPEISASLFALAAELQQLNTGDMSARRTLSVTEEFSEALTDFMNKHKVSQTAIMLAGMALIEQLTAEEKLMHGKRNSVDWQAMSEQG